MILLGTNREKMVKHLRKPRYRKHAKQKKTHTRKCNLDSRWRYLEEIEKCHLINEQLYTQFCVERELNNQLHQEKAKENEALLSTHTLAQIRDILDAWHFASTHEDKESCLPENYMQQIFTIMQ